jgi:transcriptional regulator with XRE-family HTH domain
MTPNQILKKFRRNRDMTHEQMAELFGLTRARLSQYESGSPIPPDRIREWANNNRLPDWARNMAYQMWLASLEQQYSAIGDQMQQLGQLVTDRMPAA